MKTLIISNMYPSLSNPTFGGFVQNQVEELKKREIKFIFAVNRIKKGGYVSLWKYLLLFMKIIWASTTDFDLIHAHYLFPTGFLALFPHFVRRKSLVVTAHGSDVNFGQSSRFFRSLIKFTCKRATIVIFVSEDLAEKAKSLYSISSEKIRVIDCGVDTEVFLPQDKIRLREKLSLPLDRKIILFVGNLVKVKGVNFLIESIPDILSSEPNLLTVIIGEGELEEKLKIQVKSLGIENFVQFEGFKSHYEIALWMGASDLFVLPSLSEGFGLVVLEALSSGTPVVASKVGGIPELVKDGENGFLVEPANSHNMAKKIGFLLKKDENYLNMSKKARESAFLHDVKLQIEKIVELYHKTVDKKQKKENKKFLS
ncbi:glycosyltransferase family 4 protein [Candidatus Oleimmundimicrobium sp.]|uniref:glycosyltransferase family 4 protein n=1 Tax=Candidatus Oleimmundimicrobium sp. TaxID=3060597 RepID=UPI002724C702|nr:glycosyltransferase family 4 protein [Candidatus Oleimmundimicrobium sp.]MDO8885285.1 glycosyltransferase family 4 protein [Candidatus Oleimmundimicrobium sp.]